MQFFSTLLLFITLSFSVTSVANEQVKVIAVGDTLTLPKLNDQFEKPHTLLPETKWVLFSHDMDSSKIVREAFGDQTHETMQKAKIQYYADISAMPSLISKFIAIPKMKKLKYTIVMDKEGGALDIMPKEEDKLTVLKIENGKVVDLVITADAKELRDIVLK